MTNSESEGCVLEHGEEDAIPYTQILNEFINHEQISWFSKMILIYLLARPPGWKTNTNHLASIYKGELRGNGKKAILSALKELRDFGYIGMPMPRSSFTECWVGLVLISPTLARCGTSVRWM